MPKISIPLDFICLCLSDVKLTAQITISVTTAMSRSRTTP